MAAILDVKLPVSPTGDVTCQVVSFKWLIKTFFFSLHLTWTFSLALLIQTIKPLVL